MTDVLKISLITVMFCLMGQNGLVFTSYQKLISDLPNWMSWPLGKCYKCFTGQVCLWYFIITKPFNIIELLFFVSAGIFTSTAWYKIYHWLDENR
jgi:hypothetical protein